MSDKSNELVGLPREVVDAALQNTANEVKTLVPSDANASAYQYLGAVIRAAILFYAGRGAGWALDISGSERDLIAFIGAGVAVLGWSLLQKRWAAWRTNQAAKASAAASAAATSMNKGIPTPIALEPPPNKT